MTDHTISAIPGVDSFIVTPEGLGTALRISIAWPLTAPSDNTDKASSVVYVTDADYCFGSVVEAARMGCYGGEVGSSVIVGIGYAEERGDYAFVGARRGLDFYRPPKRSLEMPGLGAIELGGADLFLDALVNTVVPEVDRRLSGINVGRRILLGMSAGGHFTAYALTQHPDLFQGYAMISPALFDFPPVPGNEQMVDVVRALSPDTIPPDTAVFLSAGSLEEDPQGGLAECAIISNAYRMRAALNAHGISTELAIFANETHFSVMGAAIARALRFLVPPETQS